MRLFLIFKLPYVYIVQNVLLKQRFIDTVLFIF